LRVSSLLKTGAWCFALSLITTAAALGQTATVSGMVTQSGTGEPLRGAFVRIEGSQTAHLTRENGRYVITNIPAGSQTLVVEMIGHTTARRTVTLTAGQEAVVNVVLAAEAISLQEIVVTGTVSGTAKAKVPFEVASLRVADMPVQALNIGSTIQGKVAGASVVSGSGRPGEAPSILLRGPKSLNASGRSQEPLYIVDGVILGSNVVDLGAQDVERVEILKGAAAASLYGSRAANGVVQITTNRGKSTPDMQVRYTARSEMGSNSLPGKFDFLQHHAWKLSPDGNQFVRNNGAFCDFLACPNLQLAGQTAGTGTANAWNSFATQPWPGGTYDQVERFFQGGDFMENYVSASGRSGATNFLVSFANVQNDGVMTSQGGFDRINFQVNVDQTIQQNLSVSATARYSKSSEDPRQGLLFDLTRMQAGVDLTACVVTPPGGVQTVVPGNCTTDLPRLVLNSNPTNTESANPLYRMYAEQQTRNRGRFLASSEVRFTPVSFLELSGNLSYDRFDREDIQVIPKGFRTISASTTLNDGQLSMRDELREALNASMTAGFRFNLGENVRNHTQVRYLYEQQDNEWNETDGFRFAVAEVPSLDNIDPTTFSPQSFASPVRSDGYFLITNFDVLDRYVIDALGRNDGSSLFGKDERRHSYYRVAGGWRLAEEPWFPLDVFDELKLRYSIGTAGGRPRFEAQYETYNVSAGSVNPVSLGNVLLKPEHTTEHEAGVDATMFGGRLGFTATYAQSRTEDQILEMPLPRYTGFSNQWQNAATLENKTWEFSVDGVLLKTNSATWSARLLFDRTRSVITEMNVPPYRYGVGGQGLGSVFYARAGEKMGTYYGVKYATGCADLPTAASCDGFAVNDDGYLVWVGAGGLASRAWGTNSGTTTVRGASLMWGQPFAAECTDQVTEKRVLACPLGNSLPDYSVGFSSTFSYKGLSLYGLLEAVQGFDIYNQPLQWALFRRNIGMMDQTGIAQEDQKPIGYYDALYNISGLQPSSVFLEDGSFVKLREVALSFRLGSNQLRSIPGLNTFNGISFRVSGNNLYTKTGYRGYDPEIGSPDGDTGSQAIARVDGYRYPNFRTWKLGVELNF
jgi:TonB-linked SusC/RagA family outer membrane protein